MPASVVTCWELSRSWNKSIVVPNRDTEVQHYLPNHVKVLAWDIGYKLLHVRRMTEKKRSLFIERLHTLDEELSARAVKSCGGWTLAFENISGADPCILQDRQTAVLFFDLNKVAVLIWLGLMVEKGIFKNLVPDLPWQSEEVFRHDEGLYQWYVDLSEFLSASELLSAANTRTHMHTTNQNPEVLPDCLSWYIVVQQRIGRVE